MWVTGTPVSVNHAYAHRPDGGKYLTPPAATWRELVYWDARNALFLLPADQQPAHWRLPQRVRCTFGGSRGDLDNLLKLTLGGLKAALHIDDQHFEPEARRNKRRGMGCLIEVWQAPDLLSAAAEHPPIAAVTMQSVPEIGRVALGIPGDESALQEEHWIWLTEARFRELCAVCHAWEQTQANGGAA